MPEKPETFADRDGFESVREKILEIALGRAAFDGWTASMLDASARDVGIDRAEVKAAFPRGVRDLLRFWSEQNDRAMLAAMAAPEFQTKKIREKVGYSVLARLKNMSPSKEAARRAAALLALPTSGLLGPRLAWATADAIWRGLGDKSTDFNFYSKRGILAGVWTSTFARWLADDSEDEAPTRAFLDARIDNVMQIEKAKARVRDMGLDPTKPIEALAKLRYPAGG